MSALLDPRARGEWRRGWTLVLASILGVALSGIPSYSTGVFIASLEHDLQWTRTQITGVLLLPSVCGVLLAPLVGVLIDRLGSRWIGIVGSIVFCVGIALLSQAGPSIASWWALWTVVAAGNLMVTPTVWSAAVSSMFERSRGLAIAVTLSGVGVCGSVAPLLANRLIGLVGWRAAYIWLGAIWAAVTVPMLILFLRDARASAGTAVAMPVLPATSQPTAGLTVREGLRARALPRLMIAALAITLSIVAPVVHMVPLLGLAGISRSTAAAIASVIGPMAIGARITSGFLIDRLSAPRVGMVTVSLPIITAVLLLAAPGSILAAITAVIFLGASIGGELDVLTYLATRHFGLRNFGALFGFIMAMLSLGAGASPAIGGYIYDSTGSYRLMLSGIIPLCALAVAMIGTLGPYPHFSDAKSASTPE